MIAKLGILVVFAFLLVGSLLYLNSPNNKLGLGSNANINLATVRAWYKFDESSGDTASRVPFGGPAVVTGTTIVPGRNNQGFARKFSGSSEMIDTKSSSLYPRRHFSVALWFKPKSNKGVLFDDQVGCVSWPAIQGTTSRFVINPLKDNSQRATLVFPKPPLNKWTFLTYTFDGKFMRVYENGQLVGGPVETSGIPWDTPKNLKIGGYNGYPFDSVNGCLKDQPQEIKASADGVIDDFQIFNYALSPEDVSELMNGGIPVATPIQTPTSQPTLTPSPTLPPTSTPTPPPKVGGSVGTTGIYYVSNSGSDNQNSGTIGAPFRTIQKCASLVKAGEKCVIRGGTYRETVNLVNSGTSTKPIIFQPYNGEKVVVSGADVVSGSWSVDSGKIYKTSGLWSLGPTKNQLFIDGVMAGIAKWPNTSGSPINVKWERAQKAEQLPSDTPGTFSKNYIIYDTNFQNQPYWDDGTGRILFMGNGWYTGKDGVVTSSQNGVLKVKTTMIWGDKNDLVDEPHRPSRVIPYYLYNTKQALDSNGEWFLDEKNGNTLYLQTFDGLSPSNHTVEFKKRTYCFVTSGVSYVNIQGLNLFSCSIFTDSDSNHITIDGIKAKYLDHDFTLANPFEFDSGIVLNGSNNTVENSEIAYGSCAAILVMGQDHQVINNVIHDFNYAPCDQGVIAMNPKPLRTLVKNNTVFNVGRDVIDRGYSSKIVYNDFYNTGLLTRDTGVVHSISDGFGTEIAYNLLHDNKAEYLGIGVYIDSTWKGNISQNYSIHHNLIWNTNYAGTLTKGNYGSEENHYSIYNNNIWKAPRSIDAGSPEGGGYQGGNTQVFDMKVFNNLTSKSIEGTDLSNNKINLPDSQFPNPPVPAGVSQGAYRDQNGNPINWTAGASFAPSL